MMKSAWPLIVVVSMMMGMALWARHQRPSVRRHRSPRSAALTIQINAADADTFCLLPGIGRQLARRVVAYREQHGLFTSVDQLQQIHGIGPHTIERVRPMVAGGTIEAVVRSDQ